MSTPCTIARKNHDGTITAIYCHYDGYPESIGHLLEAQYSEPMKLDALLKLGDIWSLGNEPVDVITPITAAFGCKKPYEVAYLGKLSENIMSELSRMYTRRMSGGDAREARTYAGLEELIRHEDTAYRYVYVGGKWRVHDGMHGRRLVTVATAARRWQSAA